MRVRDLIEELELKDPDAEVWRPNSVGYVPVHMTYSSYIIKEEGEGVVVVR